MIPARTIPIIPVKPDLRDAVRMAVGEIARFLGLFYPADQIARAQAAEIIAGQWLSRIKGFHADDDFLHLSRDFLSFLLGSASEDGGQRTQVSDQLAYYFSGFMPSYGAACTVLAMAAENQSWPKVQAFMHGLSYGNARAYVDNFDWEGGRQKAQAEVEAWKGIVERQALKMAQKAGDDGPLVLAFAPSGDPLAPQSDVPPRYRTPPPGLRPPTPGGGAPPGAGFGAGLLEWLPRGTIFITLLVISGNVGQDNPEVEWLREREKARKEGKLLLLDATIDADAAVNTTNNDCRPQSEENKKSGTECEEDGYVLMELALHYARLVDPPKGKGLDGLFQKMEPFDQPNPMPTTVEMPMPGKLIFIPPMDRPPKARNDFTGKPPKSTYPKFVVFEAKHIAKSFDEKDTEGITREAKNRLANTCDGTQLGTKWTEERIPQALKRQYPRAANLRYREGRRVEIRDEGYARWIFVCLPGPVGSNTKLYVFIDVVAAGMDLDSKQPLPRKTTPPNVDSTY